jgi:hypothetical protein
MSETVSQFWARAARVREPATGKGKRTGKKVSMAEGNEVQGTNE